jgi:hypothetical protein
MFPSAGAELRIAIAGPLVSLVLGLAFSAAAALVSLPAAVEGVVAWLGRVNLLLLAFNLLPAPPLDGGRVLRALLWQRAGDFSRATRTAGRLGRAIGQVMVAGGLLLFPAGFPDGLWFALIGWFIVGAAAAEGRPRRASCSRGFVADAMVRHPVTAQADASLAAFMQDAFARSRHTAYPVLDGAASLGRIAFRAIADVPTADWERLRVRDRLTPLDRTLVLDAAGALFEAGWSC